MGQGRTFTAPEAAELAGITYRQLDYWTRQGWVVPGQERRQGRAQRMYQPRQVVLLAALGHLGRSRVDVGSYGPVVEGLKVSLTPDFLITWRTDDGTMTVVTEAELRAAVSIPGRHVVYDPRELVRRLRGLMDLRPPQQGHERKQDAASG